MRFWRPTGHFAVVFSGFHSSGRQNPCFLWGLMHFKKSSGLPNKSHLIDPFWMLYFISCSIKCFLHRTFHPFGPSKTDTPTIGAPHHCSVPASAPKTKGGSSGAKVNQTQATGWWKWVAKTGKNILVGVIPLKMKPTRFFRHARAWWSPWNRLHD